MSEPQISLIHERDALGRYLGEHPGTRALIILDGPLHYRHLANVREAARACDLVVVATLAGTTGTEQGYQQAPQPLKRPLAAECHHLAKAGADVYFAPGVDDVFPYGAPLVGVDFTNMGQLMRTSTRSEAYFQGITQFTVKMVNLVRPNTLFMSQKDVHEVAAARQYLRDFDIDTQVQAVSVPRESNGLASDPVNHQLSEVERDQARAISQALYAGVQEAAASGSASRIVQVTRGILEDAAGVDPIYVGLVDPFTLDTARVERATACLLAVARVGEYTLSDNMLVVIRKS